MLKRSVLLGVTLGSVLAGIGWVTAQGTTGTSQALAGRDYGQIMRLYGLYNQGSDFRNAEMFVSAFAEDGAFKTGPGQEVVGRKALMAQRAERHQGQTGDTGRRHYNSSWVISLTADGGAEGRAYWFLMDVSGPQPLQVASGYYDDVFVKTPNGWRIKSRTLHRDGGGQ